MASSALFQTIAQTKTADDIGILANMMFYLVHKRGTISLLDYMNSMRYVKMENLSGRT